MSLESQIAALVDSTNQLTQTVASKMDAINTTVNAKVAELDAFKAGLLSQLPMMALNYNHDFLDVSGTAPQQLPVGLAVSADGAFWNRFSAELIPVNTGADPATRHDEAKALLDAMGIGRGTQHFTSSFNILKLTRKDAVVISSLVFYIPARHVKSGNGASFVAYAKTVGSSTWDYLPSTAGQWKQFATTWPAGTNDGRGVGSYLQLDFKVQNSSVGDVLYLALPTVVLGSWPEGRKLGNIVNIVNEVKRNFPSIA
ncbi:hypothetical protein [Mitsuaria sp. GD03876]|uniref:hypothetical protein n=1 Tax=Mitsuaria sp. GD03876 TaxID=2975399 RepID=UPI0024480AB2|nr:hypothetical protein [Mitsuaria sp. GD03876]MDH0866456.1 hypothetical protein [Mitsuaria sp. GD03876]